MDVFKAKLPIGKTMLKTEAGLFDKAISSYGVDFPEKQPDLLYARSILCSEGPNKNYDGFLRKLLFDIYKSAVNKFVDYEHDPEGSNSSGSNPNKYHIIGHIFASYLADQETGEIIPDEECVLGEDGGIFPIGSKFRDCKLDVVVDWVLYKFEFPDIAEEIYTTESNEYTGFGVSMEIYFTDYKLRVGQFKTTESFEYDARMDGAIEARSGTALGSVLNELWKSRLSYNGKSIYRILGGEAFFSGMAVTSNRANTRSWNIATASDSVDGYIQNNKEKGKLIEIIKSVASRTDAVASCNIIDGEPDCECLENALVSEAKLLVENMRKLKARMNKQDLGFEPEEEPEDLDEPLSEEEIEELREEFEEGEESIKRREEVNPKSGEKKYGDVKFADPVNKKYPIDTEEHIRAAWNYFSKEENYSKYSTKERKEIRNRIIRAWKAKIDKNGPPSMEK